MTTLCLGLEPLEGVETHPDQRDEDEADGDEGEHLGGQRGLRLLHQVPQALLVLGEVSLAKVLFNLILVVSEGLLLSNLLDDGVPPCSELVDAADLDPELLDHPEVQLLLIVKDTNLVQEVQTICPIEVEQGVEDGRVPVVKEI